MKTAGANPLALAHDASRAQYDKLMEGQGHLDNLRLELDSLLKLGDMVGPDDVVKAASNLVAKGFDPHELAVMLSGMPPQGGEGLQSWVSTQDQQIKMLEQKAAPMIAQARHQMTVNAGHLLMEDHLGRRPSAEAGPPSAEAGPGAAMGMAPTSSQATAQVSALSPSSPVMGRA